MGGGNIFYVFIKIFEKIFKNCWKIKNLIYLCIRKRLNVVYSSFACTVHIEFFLF